jgi:hypothetical protein
MTQDDLTNTLTAIASLAADAARIAGALDELMKPNRLLGVTARSIVCAAHALS